AAVAPAPVESSIASDDSSNADRMLADLRNLRLRVLVAEDNEVNQEVAREMLLDAGCSVEIVSTGVAAVEAAASGAYDLALMDCQMPEMDGFEAAGRIRGGEAEQAAGGRRRLPIVALTANAIKHDRWRFLAAGMDALFNNAVDAHSLYRTFHWLWKLS